MATKKKMLMAAAGGAGGGEPGPDVTDVFSTYLYEGNGSTQTITNGISLGDGAADGVYYQSSTNSVTGNFSPLSTITVTNTGGTSLDTSLAKFSTCYQFDGNADFLTLSQPVFDSATPFCFETWVRFNNVGSTSDMGMIANQYTGGEAGRMLFGSQNDQIVVRINGGTVYLTTGSSSVSTGTWYHVAWTYDGTTHRLYLDGTLKDSDTTMPSIYTGTNTEIGGIDPNRLSNYDLFGRLEDIRVTLGKARYTGSSYTVPTAKFPQDTLVEGQGGLVWLKGRNNGNSHYLHDSDRNITKYLQSQTTAGEQNTGPVTSFNSDGFSLGFGQGLGGANSSGDTFASWTFRKAPKFFDVVTWTGDGVAGRQIGHDLGCEVGMIVVKCLSNVTNWAVYHRGVDSTAPEDYVLRFNDTTARANTSVNWNDTAPTSTNFTVGTNSWVNRSGDTYVAYLFAHNDGDGEFGPDGDADIIKCGSYTGNGSDQEIDLGFEPQWILTKPTTFAHDWYIWDTMRGFKTYSGTDTNNLNLKPNEANAESDFDGIALTSTGFSLHGASNAANNSGQTYIYMAIRRGPLAPPESATEVFALQQDNFDSSAPAFRSDFPVDFAIERKVTSSTLNNFIVPRLTAPLYLETDTTAVENSDAEYAFDYNNGWNSQPNQGASIIAYMWKRAPNFCDVVAYTGNGTAGRTVSHNLGVVPEMMWIKRRDITASWCVYHSAIGATGSLDLDNTGASNAPNAGARFDDTEPTSSVFTVGNFSETNNNNNTYIAYLFASLPGISKVGSYTGDGTNGRVIDCGFTTGARFIIIKRTNNVGSWNLWDSVRGIVTGNDPYIELNSNNAEVTTADYIDPDASGFIVNNNVRTNRSGDTYIFYAIA